MKQLGPKSRWARWTAGELLFELVLALAACGIPFYNAWKAWAATPTDTTAVVVYSIAGAILLIALAVRAVHRNKKAQGDRELHALDGVLHALHGILTAGQVGHGLRLCIFVPGTSPDSAHQISDYVGPSPSYGHGRDMSCRCGVVGLAFRTGEAVYDELPDGAGLIDHLVSRHGFDRKEAAEMRQDAKSWAAVPVGNPGRVVAAIFLDSSNKDFFEQCRRILEGATVGVAEFIARKYT